MPTCSGVILFAPVAIKRGRALHLNQSYKLSAWGLSSTSKHFGRSSTPCQKRSQVRGRESEQWPKYMQQKNQ